MKRLFFFAASSALLIQGVAVGCGGDDSVETPGTTDATVQDGSSNGLDGSNVQQDGAVSDSAKEGSADGGTLADGSSSGSNPGKVACGASTCDAGQGVCCLRVFLDGGTTQSCESSCNGPGGFDLRCDEKADCPNPADRCCLGLGGSSCENNCPGPPNVEIALCKTSAECPADAGCNVKKCAGQTYSVCGNPIGCN